MVGLLPTAARMGKRLTLGYRQATALQDGPLLQAGDRVWGHEFHRSTLTQEAKQPLFELQGYESNIVLRAEGWSRYQVHASYTHLHFGTRPGFTCAVASTLLTTVYSDKSMSHRIKIRLISIKCCTLFDF